METDNDSECRSASLAMADVASTSPVCVNDIESVKRAITKRVARTEEHFVHLRQRSEPDMSLDERLALVEKLLANNPGEFLARFGSTLTVEDLLYFDTVCSSDYIVHYRTAEIRQRLNDAGSKLQHTVVKNRRYTHDFICGTYRFLILLLDSPKVRYSEGSIVQRSVG